MLPMWIFICFDERSEETHENSLWWKIIQIPMSCTCSVFNVQASNLEDQLKIIRGEKSNSKQCDFATIQRSFLRKSKKTMKNKCDQLHRHVCHDLIIVIMSSDIKLWKGRLSQYLQCLSTLDFHKSSFAVQKINYVEQCTANAAHSYLAESTEIHNSDSARAHQSACVCIINGLPPTSNS